MKKKKYGPEIYKAVGMRIKAVREKFNLNQGAYARKLGVSQSFLSYIEKGQRKPSFQLLFSLLSNFSINLHWLVAGRGEMINREINGESRPQEEFSRLFPGVPVDEDVLDLVRSLEVPIIKNALVEKYLLYRKRYEDFIIEHRGKKNQERDNQNENF